MEVGVTMYVLSISSLSEVQMVLSVRVGTVSASSPFHVIHRSIARLPARSRHGPGTAPARPRHGPGPLSLYACCRSAGGSGCHDVCAVYQLRLGSAHGTALSALACLGRRSSRPLTEQPQTRGCEHVCLSWSDPLISVF